MKPALTIILPAMLGHRSVRSAIDAWQAQTCRDRLELIVLCPDADAAADSLGKACKTIATGSLLLHQARAAGVRAASADAVVIAEDHCLPEPDCAEHLLSRLAEGWDGVGPSLSPGTTSASAAATFLLGYGEWMPPVHDGPVVNLPGHNAAMPRARLLAQGERLADDLLIGAFLMRRLRAAGLRYFLEPAARMTHYDPQGLGRSLVVIAAGGLSFGAVRTEGWSWPARGLFAAAFPAVAAAHWLRACRQQIRSGGPLHTAAGRLLAAIPLALAWGIAESVGGLLGRRRVEGVAWRAEIKPVLPARIAAGGSSLPR